MTATPTRSLPTGTASPAGAPRRARRLGRRVRRTVLARRRLVAAVLVAVTVGTALQALTAPARQTVPVLTVSTDLPAGHRLTATDLERTGYLPDTVPRGAFTAGPAPVVGRRLAAPVRRGEPLTDRSLVGPGLAAGRPGLQAAPVRLSDARAAALLRVGQRIDLLAADAEGARVVADCAPVLALPAEQGSGADRMPGRVVVLGLAPTEARAATTAATRAFLSFTFCGRHQDAR